MKYWNQSIVLQEVFNWSHLMNLYVAENSSLKKIPPLFLKLLPISWAFPFLITIFIFRLVTVWQVEERVSVTSICRQPVLIWSNHKILWTSIILKEVCTFRSKLVAEDLVSVDHFLTLPMANHSFNRYSRSWNNWMYLWKRMF